MTRTANATEKMKRDSLIAAAARQGTPILCALCGKPILPGQKYAFDHGHSVGLDGPNDVTNLFAVHAAQRGAEDGQGNPLDCHDKKTFVPRSRATTIGGDNYEAKKTSRMDAKHTVHKPPPGTQRPPSAWGSKRFQNGNRGFPPRGSRPMNKKRRA